MQKTQLFWGTSTTSKNLLILLHETRFFWDILFETQINIFGSHNLPLIDTQNDIQIMPNINHVFDIYESNQICSRHGRPERRRPAQQRRRPHRLSGAMPARPAVASPQRNRCGQSRLCAGRPAGQSVCAIAGEHMCITYLPRAYCTCTYCIPMQYAKSDDGW